MAIGGLFGPRDGRTLRSPAWKADLTRRRNKKNKVICGIKDEFNKKIQGLQLRMQKTKEMQKFQWPGKTQPNLHDRSFNERNQKELEKDEPRTKESNNDHFHRKREDETK